MSELKISNYITSRILQSFFCQIMLDEYAKLKLVKWTSITSVNVYAWTEVVRIVPKNNRAR